MKKRRLGSNKEVEQLAKVARSQNWQVEVTPGNHVEFRPPDKAQSKVITSLTTSDHRSHLNLKSQLRKKGLKI